MTPAQEAAIRAAARRDHEAAVAEGRVPDLTPERAARLRVLLYGYDGIDDPIAHADQRPIQPPAPVPTAVYRYYDADDGLLYVGISSGPDQRDRSHRRHSPFARFIARDERQWFGSRAEAEDAEQRAIRADRPLFNGTHNDHPARDRRLLAYLVAHDALDLLSVKQT